MILGSQALNLQKRIETTDNREKGISSLFDVSSLFDASFHKGEFDEEKPEDPEERTDFDCKDLI